MSTLTTPRAAPPTPRHQPPATPHAPLRRQIWRSRRLYLYIAPTVLLLVTFSYVPAISALYHGFFEWDVLGNASWVGLENFRTIYRDLFTPTTALEGWSWTLVQWTAWLGAGLQAAAFLLAESKS